MAEVLLQFDPPFADDAGRIWIARVCGRLAEDSLWEGWIEFDPGDGGTTLRTPPETRQPKRSDLEYWATGLTASYLDGAFDRARDSEAPDLRPRVVQAVPAYDSPAPSAAERHGAGGSPTVRPTTVLDPFEVYRQGEDVLRQELGALDEGHLRNIILAHALTEREIDIHAFDRGALAEMIVAGVRKRFG